MNSVTWTEDASDVDTSDFDSGGYNSTYVVTRNTTLSFEGHMLADEETGARDSGQLMCDIAAHNFGQGGARYIKLEAVKSTNRNSPIGHIIFLANFKKGDLGGGMEDVNSFSMECVNAGQAPVGSGVYDLWAD